MWNKLKETLKNRNWKDYSTNLSKNVATAAAVATKQKSPYDLKKEDVDFSLDDDDEKEKKDV